MVARDIRRGEILSYYPDLEPEDIREALAYAAEALVPPLPETGWDRVIGLSDEPRMP
jgi:hypothetical protein